MMTSLLIKPDDWLNENLKNNVRRTEIKMGSLKETAKAYEPRQTLNIADLEVVRTDVDIKQETRTRENGEEFTVNLVEIDGKEYRVPDSVLKALKEILIAKPNLLTFKVVKSGEGLHTSYQVIPLG